MARQNTRSRYQDGGSIFGMSDFGAPVVRKLSVFTDGENVFSENQNQSIYGMGALSDIGADYYEKAKRYYAQYRDLVNRIAKVGSAQARQELVNTIGKPDIKGTMSYTANSVDDDIRTAEQWSPANTFVWDISRRRNRVDNLEAVVKQLSPLVANAEQVHGVMPDAQTITIIREILVEKPAPPPPAPLPPPAQAKQQASQPTVVEQKAATVKTGQSVATPAWVLPVVLGGGALALGVGIYMLMQKR